MRLYSIAAVVILYNPDEQILENINSYIREVAKLFIVDNSIADHKELLQQYISNPKVTYIFNNQNVGIAKGLNIGASKAIEMGYKWLLTMDQDSRVSTSMISQMVSFIQDHNSPDTIGIVSPYHDIKSNKPLERKGQYEEMMEVMTSGNLLNLNAYLKTGPFNEALFIDCVDEEYCLRLQRNGFVIIRLNDAILYHDLGKITEHRFLVKSFTTTNHNEIRRYYMIRNRLYVMNLYKKDFPEYYRTRFNAIIKDIIKIFLFEDHKFKKYSNMFKGYFHFRQQRLGKL